MEMHLFLKSIQLTLSMIESIIIRKYDENMIIEDTINDLRLRYEIILL